MTKMEAVAMLWEIKDDIDKRVDQYKAQSKQKNDKPGMDEFYFREIELLKRRSRALEMAGSAMTR